MEFPVSSQRDAEGNSTRVSFLTEDIREITCVVAGTSGL